MKDVIEQSQYPGGTLLRITKEDLKEVLPSAPYHTEMSDQLKMILGNSHKPIKEIFDRERRV
jgi:hypothetical protein